MSVVASSPRADRGRSRSAVRRAAGVLVVLALLVRVGYVVATPGYGARHDDGDYLRLAQAIGHTGHYPTARVWVRDAPCPRLEGFARNPCVAPPRAPGARLVARPTAYRPPGYPYALAPTALLVRAFGVEPLVAARIFQVLLGTLAVALLGWLAARFDGRRTGLIALALAAVDVPLVVLSGTLLSETLFVVLELAALAAALVARERVGERTRARRWLVLAGVLIGLAALTRTNGIVLVVPVALLAVGGASARRGPAPDRARPRRRERLRRRALAGGIVAAGALLVILPWTLRNAVVLDHLVPVSTETGGTLVGTYNATSLDSDPPANWLVLSAIPRYVALSREQAALSETAVDGKLRADALRFAADHPRYLPTVLGWNTLRLLDLAGSDRVRFGAGTIDAPGDLVVVGADVFHVVLVLALLGALAPAARRIPLAFWLAPVLVFASTVMVTSETPRFRAGFEPFLILLAALGLAAASRRLGRRWPG